MKIGSIVKIKNLYNSPSFSISEIQERWVLCIWFTDDGTPFRKKYNIEQLELDTNDPDHGVIAKTINQ